MITTTISTECRDVERDQVPLIIQRIADPVQADRFKREYQDLQCRFLERRIELGRDYNRKLAELWERIHRGADSNLPNF